MDKNEITKIIENFAPPEFAEDWDCSGNIVDLAEYTDIKKVMLCLTVTDDIFEQAKKENCDMIISHHPLFFVPMKYKDINIYCAHTNLDRAKGGTTDTLIADLGMGDGVSVGDFLRVVDCKISVADFLKKICKISSNVRIVNNENVAEIKKIAFCAGSGSEFIQEAFENGADALVTGDVKFHTAIESPIVLFDIGHFESEILVLKVFENLLKNHVDVIYANEKSPFKTVL